MAQNGDHFEPQNCGRSRLKSNTTGGHWLLIYEWTLPHWPAKFLVAQQIWSEHAKKKSWYTNRVQSHLRLESDWCLRPKVLTDPKMALSINSVPRNQWCLCWWLPGEWPILWLSKQADIIILLVAGDCCWIRPVLADSYWLLKWLVVFFFLLFVTSVGWSLLLAAIITIGRGNNNYLLLLFTIDVLNYMLCY